MTIAFFDTKDYDKAAFERAGADIDFRFLETKLNIDTVGLAAGCAAVCVFVNDTVNAPVIDALCALGVKVVALRCAGYNNVDVEYAVGKIRVFHVPGYSPHAVAEHAAAMLLCAARHIHKAYNRTKDFNFSLSGLTGFDLYGKTVGIVGMGRIGRAFANICAGLGMQVLAYDKYPDPQLSYRYTDLNNLLAESDVVSLHCPLTKDSYHLINKDTLSRLKPGAVIINTSRGALIDAEALLSAIKSRHIGAACLDVYEEESDLFFEDFSDHIMDDDTLARLISMPNVLLTSHQAFLTEGALREIAQTTCQNIREALE